MRHIKPYQEIFEDHGGATALTKKQIIISWLNGCSSTGEWKLNPQTGLVDVAGSFNCGQQNLRNFKRVRFGHVKGNFHCDENQLASLDGAPLRVDGDFLCHNNSLNSLEGAPQRVGDYLFCYDNPISEAGITNVIRRMSDHNVSLEQAVSGRWKTGKWDEITEEDKPYLAKHNPDLSPEQKRGYEALGRLKTRVI